MVPIPACYSGATLSEKGDLCEEAVLLELRVIREVWNNASAYINGGIVQYDVGRKMRRVEGGDEPEIVWWRRKLYRNGGPIHFTRCLSTCSPSLSLSLLINHFFCAGFALQVMVVDEMAATGRYARPL